MNKFIHTKNIWFADLETFSPNSNYFKKHAVYYIKDKWGVMGEKDSPADMNNKQFEFLLKTHPFLLHFKSNINFSFLLLFAYLLLIITLYWHCYCEYVSI